MKKIEGDMHCHSYWSDGSDSPEHIVRLAYEKNFRFLILSDHDTIKGLYELIPMCRLFGIETMSGIEISTMHEGIYFHVLGYDFDLKAMEEILRNPLPGCVEFGSLARRILNYLSEKYEKDPTEIDAVRNHFSLPGQVSFMHVIDYMSRKIGKPFGEIKNEIFSNKKLWRAAKGMLHPVEAVDIITRTGGIASLAHPEAFLINKYKKMEGRRILEKLIGLLKDAGLFAIEAYNGQNTSEQVAYYLHLAQEYRLFTTAGSDYHGAYKENTPLGATGMDYNDFLTFKEAVKKIKS